ncbi:MAG TPA: class I SAM-dependent methyltransferase [Acidimicrobiia bacterium]
MAQFHFDPDTYLDVIRAELPAYDELERAVGDATAGARVRRVLDLGAGTGETACSVLRHHPDASFVILDENPTMLERAAPRLPNVSETIAGDLLDALPDDRFELVVSVLAIHHLASERKRALFRRLHDVVGEAGRFVMGDVIVPGDPADAVTPIEPGVDLPDRLDDLLAWLSDAGFDPELTWRWHDLVVVRADRA